MCSIKVFGRIFKFNTIYIQIFKACKFQGCHKSSILQFFEYCALQLMQAKVLKNEILRMKISQIAVDCENLENYIPRNFVRMQYKVVLRISTACYTVVYALFIPPHLFLHDIEQ